MSHNPTKLLNLTSKFEKLAQSATDDLSPAPNPLTLEELVNKFDSVTANLSGRKTSGLQRLINKYSQTVSTPQGAGMVQPPKPVEDNTPAPPPRAANAPAEREQQAVPNVMEVYDSRTQKWYPTAPVKMSSQPEGTRGRYHDGEEYVYFTKTNEGWDQDDSETPTPVVNPKDPGYASSTGNPEPTDNHSKSKANVWTGPRIDPVFQTMLGVTPDGKLGKQTQAALDAYKATVGQEGTSNALAFEYLKVRPEYLAKQRMSNDKPAEQVASNETQLPANPNPYDKDIL